MSKTSRFAEGVVLVCVLAYTPRLIPSFSALATFKPAFAKAPRFLVLLAPSLVDPLLSIFKQFPRVL
jgi:hypothetical protein